MTNQQNPSYSDKSRKIAIGLVAVVLAASVIGAIWLGRDGGIRSDFHSTRELQGHLHLFLTDCLDSLWSRQSSVYSHESLVEFILLKTEQESSFRALCTHGKVYFNPNIALWTEQPEDQLEQIMIILYVQDRDSNEIWIGETSSGKPFMTSSRLELPSWYATNECVCGKWNL